MSASRKRVRGQKKSGKRGAPPPSEARDAESRGPVAFFRRIPLKLLVAVVLFSLWTGEWYPFSSFPMYSSFPPYAYYMYVTDGEGEVIDLDDAFGVRAAKFRKTYAFFHREERLDELMERGSFEEAERTAGQRALKFLEERTRKPELQFPLRLRQVDIGLYKEGLIQEDRLIVELDEP